MKRDQLKPYVYKVEGAANLSLYNMMTGKFYRFTQEGNVEELRKELFREGLIFETEGVVPSKIVHIDLMDLKSKLFLRELQIRLNGKGEDNCWNRKKKEGDITYISDPNLKLIQEMCQYIPIQIKKFALKPRYLKSIKSIWFSRHSTHLILNYMSKVVSIPIKRI